MTVPPELRTASAWSSAPRTAPSCSQVRLPRSSAVVARMIATSGAMAGKNSQSSPARLSCPHDGFPGRGGRHGAAFPLWIHERVEPDLGQHARPFRSRLPVHVEEDAGRNVVRSDRVLLDHPADRGRIGRGGAGRVGTADRALEEPRPRDVVDALHGVHVPCRDRVERGQIAGMGGFGEAPADRFEHRVRTAEPGRRRHRDDCAVGNDARGLACGQNLHRATTTVPSITALRVPAPPRPPRPYRRSESQAARAPVRSRSPR